MLINGIHKIININISIYLAKLTTVNKQNIVVVILIADIMIDLMLARYTFSIESKRRFNY